MAVWFAAAAAVLFYLGAVPVKFALNVHISDRTGFGAGASVFEGRYALRSANLRARGLKKRRARRKKFKPDKSAALPAALKAAKHILKHLRLEKLQASGRLSLQDAAGTALVCGCARSLEGMLLPFAHPGAVQLQLEPDFSIGRSDIMLCGMVSIRAGHIILAALIGAWNYMIRRNRHGKASD